MGEISEEAKKAAASIRLSKGQTIEDDAWFVQQAIDAVTAPLRKKLGKMYVDRLVDCADYLADLREEHGQDYGKIPEFVELHNFMLKAISMLEARTGKKI